MHIAASVFINDDERGLHADYEKWLEELAPHAPVSQYQHNRTGEACPACTCGAAQVSRAKGQCRCAPEAERNSQCCA
jgi:hypothetical protein